MIRRLEDLGLELLSLSLYAMVAFNRDSPACTEAAMKYFVLGSMASGMLLYGMSIAFAPAYLPADYTFYSIILTFVVLALVLAVRPFGLYGRPE